MTSEEFRLAMDGDTSFQSKRKALTWTSLVLLAITASGAQIKEANTFILKIEFTTHIGLTYLLVLAVIGCTLRYYSYSEKYHNQLLKFWSDRLMNDFRIYYANGKTAEIEGLIGKKVDIYTVEYDVDKPQYIRSGFLKREIGFRTSTTDENGEEYYIVERFRLNEYKGNWTAKDLRQLLRAEFKYRLGAWIKHRETLDLISPYLLAISSLLLFSISLYKP